MRILHLFICALGIMVSPVSGQNQGADPCPPGRSLERQISIADAVILGKVTRDRNCSPWDVTDGRLSLDCHGRRVSITVMKSWKGNLRRGSRMFLIMNAPKDSSDIVFRTGQRRVIFAKREGVDTTQWLGETSRCMYPEAIRSDKELIKQLDTWKRKQSPKP
jgi:hypothetical protein